ncbi:hypothetical protein DEO72_LG7g1660 [Vigna unguiculata]|uniref:Uncharacterized protein n=1 Tax=Vigna unguiculata TaxID=3917 RepID=A0A4D6MG02_VIGUN|nr:hypothetical protein DEO72_LG7g1660 [Vigna unguiculata]
MAGVQKKSVQLDVLVWRLAEGFSSPDDSDGSDGNVLTWRLAAKSFPPGDSCNISGLLECVCLAVWVVPPGMIYKAFGDASKVGLLVFIDLWLETMTSLKLWLGMADENEERLSCGSGWRVLPM